MTRRKKHKKTSFIKMFPAYCPFCICPGKIYRPSLFFELWSRCYKQHNIRVELFIVAAPPSWLPVALCVN